MHALNCINLNHSFDELQFTHSPLVVFTQIIDWWYHNLLLPFLLHHRLEMQEVRLEHFASPVPVPSAAGLAGTAVGSGSTGTVVDLVGTAFVPSSFVPFVVVAVVGIVVDKPYSSASP